uniref:RAB35, member RAS onco family n=1 Tax=Astyanax mexicanus TaxID=7994 RepID=A0A8B9LV46_ASTMX
RRGGGRRLLTSGESLPASFRLRGAGAAVDAGVELLSAVSWEPAAAAGRDGAGLRLPLQAAHHRRQRCREKQSTPEVCRQHIFRYYRGTHGVIVVYDVTSAESFVNVKRWLHEINQNCDDVCRILVGNKNDDPGSKVVETNDAQKFAEQMDIRLFETSAKENINVEDMFNCITELVLKARKESVAKQQQQQQSEVVKLSKNSKRKKKCC